MESAVRSYIPAYRISQFITKLLPYEFNVLNFDNGGKNSLPLNNLVKEQITLFPII